MTNVIDINYMFYKCEKIKSLPDLSKWCLKNCIYRSNIFNECYSLDCIIIPKLSFINSDEEYNKICNDSIYKEQFLNDLGFNENYDFQNSFDNNMDDLFDENSNKNLFE